MKIAVHKTIVVYPDATRGETVYTETLCAMSEHIMREVMRRLMDSEMYVATEVKLDHGSLVEYQFEFTLTLGG